MTAPADFLRQRDRAAAMPEPGIDPGRPCWIFGAGGFGRSLASAMQAQGITVAGFVETAPRTAAVQGLPVLDWSELTREARQAQLAMGIFNRDTPYDQLLRLPAAAGFNPPLMPWTLYEPLAQTLGWRFWLSPRAFLLDGLERIAQAAQQLADPESMHTLYRICAFRLGLDMGYASFQSAEKQYFNALTLPALQGRAITYVDCGAYDGDTFGALLAQPRITCAQAFLLEPDPANYARLVQRAAAQAGAQAVCLPLAAAQVHSSLTFQTGQGEACALVNEKPHGGGYRHFRHGGSAGRVAARHSGSPTQARHRRRRSPGTARRATAHPALPPGAGRVALPQPPGSLGAARAAVRAVRRGLPLSHPPTRVQLVRRRSLRRALQGFCMKSASSARS